MVFNWFRRQFNTSEESSEQISSETPQVEEKAATEQPTAESAEPDSTQERSPADADDYLNWAKAAYKNIQKQQSPEATETATEPSAVPETIEATETIAASTTDVEDTVTPTEAATTPVEPEEPVAPEIPEPEEEASPPASDVARTEEETAIIETVQATPEPEPASEEPAGDRVEAEEPPSAPESETIPDVTQSPITSDDTQSPIPNPQSPIPNPQSPIPNPQSPVTSQPSWMRQANAERQARLERLKATAIETEEPEPVRPAARQEEPATTVVEEVPGLAFDEGFLWSAEVLAAQGRRPEDVSIEEISWLKRLRQGLDKTRRNLVNQLKAIVGQGPLNQDAVMEIEALLLQADVGVEATDYIIETLQKRLREEVLPPEQAIAYLKQILRDLLDKPCSESYSPTFVPEKDTFTIWLMTGVNGVGKTTTIGKVAHLAKKSGYRCLIAAADTFRAAAVEQVRIWGERSGTEVISNPGKNTDPAAVVFDAITAAQARNIELLLVDTAGRLQNKKNLMDELAKVRRIIDKKAPDAKVESLLVLDATLGQNGLRQAEVFSEAAKLSGVVLTKLDGTAKGGVALAVVKQMGLPIRFIGAGEGIEDLRPFSSYEFVEALLSG